MEYVAQHGYDVYLVDLRGYGRSTRPTEMDQPAADNPPIVRTETAIKDVSSAVEFIFKTPGGLKDQPAGLVVGYDHHGLVHDPRTTTRSTGWCSTPRHGFRLRHRFFMQATSSVPTASYRVRRQKNRWLTGVAEDKRADLIPAGWFEAWADATFATDPAGAKQTPQVLRAPNGVVQDSREFWSLGKPLYDPAGIRVPTFLAHAEWDADLPNYMLYEYFAKLTKRAIQALRANR